MPTTQIVKKALIALGSNVASIAGSPENTAKLAISALKDAGWRVSAVSRFYRSPAFPVGSGPDFVNAALALDLDPATGAEEVLAGLHRVETAFGRTRRQRWESRTLDLDLLALDNLVLPDAATHGAWMNLPPSEQQTRAPEALILPHPRLQDRAFVLLPLQDIAPGWQHPVLGTDLTQMIAALPADDVAAVTPL